MTIPQQTFIMQIKLHVQGIFTNTCNDDYDDDDNEFWQDSPLNLYNDFDK